MYSSVNLTVSATEILDYAHGYDYEEVAINAGPGPTQPNAETRTAPSPGNPQLTAHP